MSKLLLSFSLLLSAIFSCKNEKKSEPEIDYTGFSPKDVLLTGFLRNADEPDTIGQLSIKIPSRLDTFYQWHRTSDCTPCGALQYRFADKKYIQFAESGWFWTYTPDSVYQFTISHTPTREAPDSIIQRQLTLKDTPLCSYIPNLLTDQRDIIYLKKELREINNRGFIITAFITPHGEMTNQATLYLTAMTGLKKRMLKFIAECGAKDTAGFIENMYLTILSVKIEEK